MLHLSHKLDVWMLVSRPSTSSHMPNVGSQKSGRYRPSSTGRLLTSRVQIPLSQMAYQGVMAGGWVLLILDVIGAGVLAAALIIVLWRRAAHRAQNEATRENYDYGG